MVGKRAVCILLECFLDGIIFDLDCRVNDNRMNPKNFEHKDYSISFGVHKCETEK